MALRQTFETMWKLADSHVCTGTGTGTGTHTRPYRSFKYASLCTLMMPAKWTTTLRFTCVHVYAHAHAHAHAHATHTRPYPSSKYASLCALMMPAMWTTTDMLFVRRTCLIMARSVTSNTIGWAASTGIGSMHLYELSGCRTRLYPVKCAY